MNLESLTFFIIGLAFGIILGIVGYFLFNIITREKKWAILILLTQLILNPVSIIVIPGFIGTMRKMNIGKYLLVGFDYNYGNTTNFPVIVGRWYIQ